MYLPVPTISREVKVRPATVQGSLPLLDPPMSPASDKMHDLDPVAIRNRRGLIGRSRNDLQISFHRNLAGVEFQVSAEDVRKTLARD